MRLAKRVSVAQREFPQIYPRPGWVEHDPDAIWKTQLNTARRALRLAKLSAGDVAAIGITNQRETTLHLGSRHRQAHRQRHRLAGSPHGGHLRCAAKRQG